MAKVTKKELKKLVVELENLKGAFKSFQYINDEVSDEIFKRYCFKWLVFHCNLEKWCKSYKKGFKAINSEKYADVHGVYYENEKFNNMDLLDKELYLMDLNYDICFIKGYIKL